MAGQYNRPNCVGCKKELRPHKGFYQAFAQKNGKTITLDACTKAHANKVAKEQGLEITGWHHTTRNSLSEMFSI